MTLTDRFNEIIHWTWDKFWELEHDPNASNVDAMICAFIRAMSEGDKKSIKHGFARSDGEVEIPIEFKVPKFYVRYLVAKGVEGGSAKTQKQIAVPEEEISEYDVATAKLRDTLQEMKKAPKGVVRLLLAARKQIDHAMLEEEKLPDHVPLVKSIICANFLHIAQSGDSEAIKDVFEQLDGRLAKTITILGGHDVYLDDYSTEKAPKGAIKDKDGVWVAENEAMANLWISRIAPDAIKGVLNDED